MNTTPITAIRPGGTSILTTALALWATATGCGPDDHVHGAHENEVITTVVLTFMPASGGSPVVVTASDPDGDGGKPIMVGGVALAPGNYDLGVSFENRLESPAEDLTPEIRDEQAEHQIFLLGTAVEGPAGATIGAPLVHSYADQDENGLPVGLRNQIVARAGSGIMTLVLRHLPPVNGMPVKTAGANEAVRRGGLAGLGGTSDAQIDFPVTVM